MSYDSRESQQRQPSGVPWHRRPLRAVPTIIAINAVVFLVWQFARSSVTLRLFMITNFETSATFVVNGRAWTLITSAFSHFDLLHLLVNMFVLYSFGAVLERFMRPPLFTGFYLSAAVFSSVVHCITSAAIIGDANVRALGASGAVSGLLMLTALLFPHARIYLFGVIPVPALAGVLGFVGLDLWGLIAQGQGGGLNIGHGAHLGGAAFGALFFYAYLRRRLRPAGAELSAAEHAELTRLHQKMTEHGAESLTIDERDFLRSLQEQIGADDN